MLSLKPPNAWKLAIWECRSHFGRILQITPKTHGKSKRTCHQAAERDYSKKCTECTGLLSIPETSKNLKVQNFLLVMRTISAVVKTTCKSWGCWVIDNVENKR